MGSLYTDFWASPVTRRLAQEIAFGPLRSLACRFHPALVNASVKAWSVRTLLWEAGRKWESRKQKAEGEYAKAESRKKKWESAGPYRGFIEVGRQFAVRVREALKKRKDLGRDSIFFAYDTAALEALEWCREQGIKTILNHMDPNRVEVDLVREEEMGWPGWALHPIEVPEAYFERREREWALADRVLVNSEFCRSALLKQGVPPEKLVVVPLCFERESGNEKAESRKQKAEATGQISTFQISNFCFSPTRPLRVLFLGQVILRKGIQYLIQAARQLERESIVFDVVGPVGISKEAVASAPGNVRFHGRAGRDQAGAWYEKADVFVLPTLSDGFAITQLEAMAHGLPVVTTPCCGDVVTEGVDGFIVPPRDAELLAKALQRYLAEPGLLRSQQEAAVLKASQFSLDRLAANLLSVEKSLLR